MAAPTLTALTSGKSTTDGTVFTTASITPTANSIVLLVVVGVSGTPVHPSSISGNGLTWEVIQGTFTTGKNSIIIYQAQDASPSSGVITITFAASKDSCLWSVVEFDNVHIGEGGDNAIQTGEAFSIETGVTSISQTLTTSANKIGMIGFSAFVHDANEGKTADTGVEIHDEFHDDGGTGTGLMTSWNNPHVPTQGASWATSSDVSMVMIGILGEDALLGTLAYADGFEIGGLELAQGTIGSPSILGSIASPAGRSGAFALRLNPASTQEQYRTWGGASSGGTLGILGGSHALYGFAVRFSDLAPGTEYVFAAPVLANAVETAFCFIDASGNFRFEDATGATVFTEITPFTVDTWNYTEIALQINNNVGAYEVWLDGVSLSSGTSDFWESSSNLEGIIFGGAGTGDGNVDIDDFYAVSHTATLQGNNLGPSEVFAYQVGPASATADSPHTFDNDTLDTNNWDAAAATPLASATFAAYTGSATNGARIFDEANNVTGHGRGPVSGAYTVTGTIQGAMWLGVYQRGTGGGTFHHQYHSNSGETTEHHLTMDTIANSADTFRAFVFEIVGRVPTVSESFVMGFGTTGAQNIECLEMWAFILHTPVVQPPDVFPLLPYKKPENTLLRM